MERLYQIKTASIFLIFPVAYLYLLPIFIFTMLGVGCFSTYKIMKEEKAYDTIKIRSLRIKEQMVQRLKEKNISKQESNELLENIKYLQELIDNTYENKNMFDSISQFLSSRVRKEKRIEELHRNLEALGMNDLFVKSAKLKSL